MARPKGIPCSEEHRAKLRAISIANGAVNRLRTPEAKQKAEATRAAGDFRARCREARGTEEQRRKTSEASSAVWATLTPEQRAARTSAARNSPKRLAAMREALSSDGNKKRAGEAWSRRWNAFSEEEKKEYISRSTPKMTATMRRRWTSLTDEEKNKVIARWQGGMKRKDTSIERIVAGLLDALGVAYELQKRIGRWSLDFYVPSKNLNIECDGEYWHSLPAVVERDTRRDVFMAERGISVLRLPEGIIKSGLASSFILKAVS